MGRPAPFLTSDFCLLPSTQGAVCDYPAMALLSAMASTLSATRLLVIPDSEGTRADALLRVGADQCGRLEPETRLRQVRKELDYLHWIQ